MRNLSIRFKLILGFSAVGAITLLIGLIGWLGLFHLKVILKEINGVRLPGIIGVADLQGNMWAIQRFERVLLYEKDPEIIKRQYLQLDEMWSESSALMNKYKHLPKSKGEEEIWQKLVSKWEAWKALHQTVIALVMKGDPNSLKYAHDLSYGQARSLFLESQEIFNNLLNLALKITTQSHQEAENSEYRARITLTVWTFCGVLGIMLLGLFVTQSIQKSHEALQKSENWFSTTLRSLGDALIATDPQGQVTFMNPIAQTMTGWTMEEGLGRPVEEVFHIVNEETGAAVENPVIKVIREGMVVGLANHTLLIAKDGTRVPINDSGAPIKDDQGNLLGTVLVFQDITELKEAMDGLRRREQETQVLVNNIPGIVFTGYIDGSVDLIDFNNDKVEPLTGYSKMDFDHRHLKWTDLIVREDQEGVQQVFLQALKNGNKTYVREYRIKSRGGREAWIQERSHIVCDQNGKVENISGILFDVTEMKQAEKTISEQSRILEAFFQYTFKPMAILDKNLDFIRVNLAYTKSGPQKLDYYLRHHHFELYPSDIQEIFTLVLQNKIHFQENSWPFIHPDQPDWGVTYWNWSLTPLLDHQGEVEFLILSLDEVTESKRAEEALKASELEYRLLFENAQVGVFRNRLGDGKILKANHRMAELLGYEDYQEFMQEFYSSVHYVDPATREKLIASFREGRLDSHEIGAFRKDGSIIWLLISGRINPEEGYVEGVATDITQLKAGEEALREGESFMASVLDSIQDSICAIDNDYTILRANKVIQKWFNVTQPPEGKKCFQAFHGLSEPCPDCPAQITMETGEASRAVLQRFIGQEAEKLVEVYSYPLFDLSTGKLKGIIEYGRDITERKKAEEALQDSEERMRLVIESSPIGVFLGKQGRLVFANPALAKMHGYDNPGEMIGQSMEVFLAPEDQTLINHCQEAMISNGSVVAFDDARGLHKNGEFFDISIWLTKLDYQGEPAVLGFIIDVTEQKALRAQLFQAQKMEAIGTLAGGIAHDFNNILSALIGYTEMALDDVADGSEAHDDLEEVLRAAERARDLVKQILTFSRQRKPEKKPVQVSMIVQEALKFLRASLPTTIDIRQAIISTTGRILADPTQIHQVLINLCTNAAQAMEENGGILSVSLDEVYLTPGDQVLGPDMAPGPYLRLFISDTGRGMAPEVTARIFEPFFTTKKPGKGTGMGLAVVHGIVKSHDGDVKVYSEPGKGTAFQIFFPLIDVQEQPDTATLLEIPGGDECILLVDDESSLVRLGELMLERLGYEVVAKTSSLEALEAFQAQPDRFDLVITDQTMPYMTGTKLAEELRRLRPELPIILCTGFSETIEPEKVKSLNIREVVIKPWVKAELAVVIRRELAGDALLIN